MVFFKLIFIGILINIMALPDYSKYLYSGSPVDQTYQYLKGRGIPDVQAFAIIGNIYQESQFNPNIYNLEGSGAYGIHQWLGVRKNKLIDTYGEKPTLENQLEFLIDEHNGKYRGYGWNYINNGAENKKLGYYNYSRNEFNNATSIPDATIAWNQGFGRPGKNELANDKRIAFAEEVARYYGVNTIPQQMPTEMTSIPIIGQVIDAQASKDPEFQAEFIKQFNELQDRIGTLESKLEESALSQIMQQKIDDQAKERNFLLSLVNNMGFSVTP